MLLEFSVENFKSIKEKIFFSMISDDSIESHSENCFAYKNNNLLKSALIYGANAAGKSSFIESIGVLQWIIRLSAKNTPEDKFPITPFKLSKKTITKPTKFDIHFVYENIHYNYNLSIKPQKVISEKLYYYKNGKKIKVFKRSNNNIELANSSETDEETAMRQKIYKENISDNILFLSQANNIKDVNIKNAFNWFSEKLYCINYRTNAFFTDNFIKENKEYKDIVLNFLKNADPFIANFYIEKEETTFPESSIEFLKMAISKKNRIPVEEIIFEKAEKIKQIFQRHSIDKDSNCDDLIDFEMKEESMGTRRYYNLLGPIIKAIKNGNVIICDEFENSLHYLLVKKIFNYFLSKENKNGAQLIATTHNVILLTDNLFRNDQIWFVDKTYQAATKLYSLSEVDEPPTSEALLKEYLRGTLGGVNPRL